MDTVAFGGDVGSENVLRLRKKRRLQAGAHCTVHQGRKGRKTESLSELKTNKGPNEVLTKGIRDGTQAF